MLRALQQGACRLLLPEGFPADIGGEIELRAVGKTAPWHEEEALVMLMALHVVCAKLGITQPQVLCTLLTSDEVFGHFLRALLLVG